jgi:hypothetical protein
MRATPFLILAVLASGLLAWSAADEHARLRSEIKDRDLEKLAAHVDGYFKGLEGELMGAADTRRRQVESLTALEEELANLAKRNKLQGSPLKYLGDWERIVELAKPQDRDLSSKAGRGFELREFVDPYGESASIAYLLSLPKAYGKAEELFPAVLALKPRLELSGRDLEQAVKSHAEAIYGELTAEAIILIPIGPQEGTGRNQEVTEIPGSWLTPEGMLTCFTTMRVLSEQVQFDRSRLVLDGWGAAGGDALRLASRAPQWFAGVIDRGGEVGPLGDVIDPNLEGLPVAYVAAEGGGATADEARLKDLDAEVIRHEGGPMEPTAEARSSLQSWILQRRRELVPTSIDFLMDAIEYQSIFWVKAAHITRRPTAQPGEEDFPRIQAEADRAKNAIDIKTVGIVDGVRVFLSDALVDLDKPVTITVNGKQRVQDTFERSAQTLLTNRFFNNSGDLGIYTAEVLIEDLD